MDLTFANGFGDGQQQASHGKIGVNEMSRSFQKQGSFTRSSGSPYLATGSTSIKGGQRSSFDSQNTNSNAPGAIDKSMLPGHNQSSLSAKLEATRAAFKASQAKDNQQWRPMSSGGKRPGTSNGGGGSGGPTGSTLRNSDPSPTMNRRDGDRPRAFTCYLCGQQFGSQSLLIHIGACQKKWIMVEEAKLPRERRALPPPPPEIASGQLPTSGTEIDAFNQAMTQYWDKMSLISCPICARTFRPDAYEKHTKVCTPDRPGGPLGPGKAPPGRGAAAGRGAGPGRGSPGGPRPGSSRGGGSMTGRGGGGGGMGGGGGGGMSSKPRGFMCYLCGQQYGSHSLFIHIPQCQKKWMMVEAAKPNRERRALPPPPPYLSEIQELPTDGPGIDEFNCRMSEYWDKVSLVVCNICGRSFRPDAFEKHTKVCTPDNPGVPLGMPKGGAAAARAAASAAGGMKSTGAGGSGGGGSRPAGGGGGGNYDSRPRAFVCYLCGQQYGSKSLLIHIPQCYEKWLKVEAAKDPKSRRDPPPPPPELDQPLPANSDQIDAFNQRMFDIYNGVSLMKCQHCGRTMKPEALSKHQKLCTAESPMKGAGGGGGNGPTASPSRPGNAATNASGNAGPSEYPDEMDPGDLEQCQHCGRRMRPEALMKHNKVCTADKPMKSVARAPATGPPHSSHPTTGAGNSSPSAPSGGPEGAAASPRSKLAAARTSGGPPSPSAARTVGGGGGTAGPSPLGSPTRAGTNLSNRLNNAAGDGEGGGDGDGMEEGLRPSPPRQPAPPSHPGGEGPSRPSPGRRTVHPNTDQDERQNDTDADVGQDDAEAFDHDGGGIVMQQYDNEGGYGDDGVGEAGYRGGDGGDCDRVECPTCGRRFAPDAYDKHSRVCAKVFATKRKPFNMAKQRLQGTEAVGFAGRASARSAASSSQSKGAAGGGGGGGASKISGSGGASEGKPAWKAQSENLRAAMANMREVKAALARGEDIRNIPVVPSAPDPSYKQCPHCGRRFAPKAAERHIVSCANTQAKPKFLKAGTGGSGQGAPQSKTLPRY